MSDIVIRVENLGKQYRLGQRQGYRTIRDTFSSFAASCWGRLTSPKTQPVHEEKDFWALREVSFEVNRGEVVGVIGRNGAGKSTLLKILSQITEPTTGRVELTGRVGSLLEVGTGFHPELTGRENIYLNGAILGMKRIEITRKFDEIVAFAEVEKFIDTAVKHYSTGMYMRLAFGVAAHLDPEILIVDEVLAVGDVAFQHKCLGKMDAVAKGGKTALFVSHNMSAIQRLCEQSILLNTGRVVRQGLTEEVVRSYLTEQGAQEKFTRPPQTDGRPTITSGALVQASDFMMRIELEVTTEATKWVSLDVRLTDEIGNPVGFGSLGALAEADRVLLGSRVNRVAVGLWTDRLALGSYTVSLDLTDPEVMFYDRAEDCLRFEVARTPSAGRDRVHPQRWRYGAYELPIERLSN